MEDRIEKNWEIIDQQEKEIDELFAHLKVKNKEFMAAQKKNKEKLEAAEKAVQAMLAKQEDNNEENY